MARSILSGLCLEVTWCQGNFPEHPVYRGSTLTFPLPPPALPKPLNLLNFSPWHLPLWLLLTIAASSMKKLGCHSSCFIPTLAHSRRLINVCRVNNYTYTGEPAMLQIGTPLPNLIICIAEQVRILHLHSHSYNRAVKLANGHPHFTRKAFVDHLNVLYKIKTSRNQYSLFIWVKISRMEGFSVCSLGFYV